MRTERERGLEETVSHPDTSKDVEVTDVFSAGFKLPMMISLSEINYVSKI